MKVCIILFLATCGATLAANVTVTEIRQAWFKVIEPLVSQCLCQSKADSQHLVEFVKSGTVSEDPCWKCELRCYALTTHVMSTSGEIDVELWAGLGPYVSVKLLRDCVNKVVEVDLCEKMQKLNNCVYEELAKQYPP